MSIFLLSPSPHVTETWWFNLHDSSKNRAQGPLQSITNTENLVPVIKPASEHCNELDDGDNKDSKEDSEDEYIQDMDKMNRKNK